MISLCISKKHVEQYLAKFNSSLELYQTCQFLRLCREAQIAQSHGNTQNSHGKLTFHTVFFPLYSSKDIFTFPKTKIIRTDL